jgi:hypothetical protein
MRIITIAMEKVVALMKDKGKRERRRKKEKSLEGR